MHRAADDECLLLQQKGAAEFLGDCHPRTTRVDKYVARSQSKVVRTKYGEAPFKRLLDASRPVGVWYKMSSPKRSEHSATKGRSLRIDFARLFPRFVWLNRCQSAPPCSLPLHPYQAGDTIGLVSCLHGCERSDRHRISTVTRWSPHWHRSRDHFAWPD